MSKIFGTAVVLIPIPTFSSARAAPVLFRRQTDDRNQKDRYTAEVFNSLVAAGAPAEILYLAKPHLGTDKLALIVQNIRAEIVSLGGEYRFENRLEDLTIDQERLKAVKIRAADGTVYEEPVSHLVLAVGHSARDTFEMLHRRGVPMTAKAFSVGVRIEHPQSLINRAVYHDFAEYPGWVPPITNWRYTCRTAALPTAFACVRAAWWWPRRRKTDGW